MLAKLFVLGFALLTLNGCATFAIGALLSGPALFTGIASGTASGVTQVAIKKEAERRAVWREHCHAHPGTRGCTGWYGK